MFPSFPEVLAVSPPQTVDCKPLSAGLWVVQIPWKGNGHGRPACKFGETTFVGEHSLLTAGWSQLPTASRMRGKWRGETAEQEKDFHCFPCHA